MRAGLETGRSGPASQLVPAVIKLGRDDRFYRVVEGGQEEEEELAAQLVAALAPLPAAPASTQTEYLQAALYLTTQPCWSLTGHTALALLNLCTQCESTGPAARAAARHVNHTGTYIAPLSSYFSIGDCSSGYL